MPFLVLPGKKILIFIIVLNIFIGLVISFQSFSYSNEIIDKNPIYHPHSKPIEGRLFWEDNEKFKELCSKYNVLWRMGAYQTTIPDPLPGEKYNVELAIKKLRGTVLSPGAVFSMNQRIGPYTVGQGFQKGRSYQGSQLKLTYGGGVCKVASVLYNAALLANLQIIERHNHGMLVPYMPPGKDAAVAYGAKDFRFKNNTKDPLFIWADTIDNTIYITIYGWVKPPKISWQQEIVFSQKYPVIYRNNSKLKKGEKKVIMPGANGFFIRSWLLINSNESTPKKKYLGADYYKPMPRVIEQGPK